MPSEQIQWFPGHMAKTRRLITENLKNVDIVIEILDARIPYSSRNPEINRLTEQKPRLVLLNKASLADPKQTEYWCKRLSGENVLCIATDCIQGNGVAKIMPAVREILADKLERYENKGMNRRLKAMVLGIPNVGKSSLINKISGNGKAKVENRPGVTLAKQWIPTEIGIHLLDMPGVLWPKFEDDTVGARLAITGAIADRILDTEEIAMIMCTELMKCAPEAFMSRYKLKPEECDGLDGYDLFNLVGKKRGMLMSGGEINAERCSAMLLEEFRNSKIGRITLDIPE